MTIFHGKGFTLSPDNESKCKCLWSESIGSLMCNLKITMSNKLVDKVRIRLMKSILSTILLLTKERSINFYLILIGQLKHSSDSTFYEDLLSILKLPEDDNNSLVPSLKYHVIMIIRKMGIFAIWVHISKLLHLLPSISHNKYFWIPIEDIE